MDKAKLSDLLDIAEGGTFRTKAVAVDSWGSSLTFDCSYEMGNATTAFTLTLEDCREIQWRVYAHLKHPEDQTLPTATFVNLRLGSDNHRKPLHLLTDFFGLTVSYGRLRLEKQIQD